MTERSNEETALKVARAKSRATAKVLKLMLFVRGGWALGVAITTTALLTFFLHLNAPLAFAGSLIGALILAFARVPIGKVWMSSYSTACQEEGLWSRANAAATEGVEDSVKGILEGNPPETSSTELNLKLSNLQTIFIRKGDLKGAAKLAEFLYRNSQKNRPNDRYLANGLGTICLELGNYEKGFQLLTGTLDELEKQNRTETPAYVTALLGLTQVSLDLERIDDAERYLNRMRKAASGVSDNKQSANKTDQWIQQTIPHNAIHTAFDRYFSAKLKALKEDSEADLEIAEAVLLVENPEVMKKVTLFYPELLGYQAYRLCRKKEFDKAIKMAERAIEYYETKLVNRGNEYFKAKRLLAYARMKQGADTAEELESLLQQTRDLVFEPQHGVTLALQQSGEAWAARGDIEKARTRLRESLKMKQRLFPENSPGIRETEALLAALPKEEPVQLQS